MRAGLNTIQQTLTPDAAAVLTRSIAEASRRGHGQTTPLHVAATLLTASSGGLLRQACVRSHPASAHPLQCRALELCFSVALDRLPAAAAGGGEAAEPPLSNALMAALKRAQAHQRRGCPEQQQQPLLAVKVELEQLVVSILDDPSVSRVMREASFSSPAVKASIERTLSAAASPAAPLARNLYINPRLQQGTAGAGSPVTKDEAQRVLDIMARPKKRNPIVVADTEPGSVVREVLQRIAAGNAPPPLRAVQVINLDKEFTVERTAIPAMIKELGSSVEARIADGSCRGVVLDLGDLKWLVEAPAGAGASPGSDTVQQQQQQQQQQIVSEMGRAVVAEMTKVIQRFAGGGESRLWLIGTATCSTYLRCQVYHPSMDSDWDLQALPIALRSPALPISLPRSNGILSSSVESLAPMKGFPALGTSLRRPSDSTDSSRTTTPCPACMEGYEKELAIMVADKFEKSSADSKPEARPTLPHWLQNSKSTTSDQLQSCKQQELGWKQSTEELLKRWRDTCSRLHPPSKPVLLGRAPSPALNLTTFSHQTPLPVRLTVCRGIDPASNQRRQLPPNSPPGSPVKTELALGHPKVSDVGLEKKADTDRLKDLTGSMQDGFRNKMAGVTNLDSFKRLFKGLAERVSWQTEAASAVAALVMQCKSGGGKRRGAARGAAPRGDAWLLFIGPDIVGKRKMAASLSELVFGASPVTVNLAGDSDGAKCRGRTSIDRVSEAIRRNPFSVVLLEGIDRADVLTRVSIKGAIERGRLVDSQGREVSLGSVIFVLCTDWLPEERKTSHNSMLQCEEGRILSSANCGWQLELSVGDWARKRKADHLCEGDDRPTKLRKDSSGGAMLSLDLNLSLGVDDVTPDSSRNSSDVTDDHSQESVRLAINCATAAVSSASELIELVDGTIDFKPVDFGPIRKKVAESIHSKFSAVMGNRRLIRVDDDALDRMVGGLWLTGGAASAGGFEEWANRALVPSIQQLSHSLMSSDRLVIVRLSAVNDVRREWTGFLPPAVAIARDGTSNHDEYLK